MRLLLTLVVLALIGTAFAARAQQSRRATRRLGSAECDICTWVVTQAESMLAQNSTEQEIITELDKACSIFGPFSAECQSLVATYVPQVVQLLEQKVPPSQICSQLGLCTSKSVRNVNKRNHNKRGPARGFRQQ